VGGHDELLFGVRQLDMTICSERKPLYGETFLLDMPGDRTSLKACYCHPTVEDDVVVARPMSLTVEGLDPVDNCSKIFLTGGTIVPVTTVQLGILHELDLGLGIALQIVELIPVAWIENSHIELLLEPGEMGSADRLKLNQLLGYDLLVEADPMIGILLSPGLEHGLVLE
jgi:hypothetical protein